MRFRAAAAALVVLGAAACGSTAQVKTSVLSPGGSVLGGQGGELGEGGLPTSAPTTTGTTVAGGTGGGLSPGGSTGTNSGGSTGFGSTGGPTSVPTLHGVSSTTVDLGIVEINNGSAANQAVGGKDFTSGNAKTDYGAVAKDINAHGGIGGRTLRLFFASIDPTSTVPIDQQQNTACTQLTQDHHVFAMIPAAPNDAFRECARKAGVPLIDDGGQTTADASTFSRFPDYVEAASVNLDRLVQPEISALQQQGYFSGWDTLGGGPSAAAPVKVGVIALDLPSYRHAVTSQLLPALARAGHAVSPSDVQYVYFAQQDSTAGQEASGISSAELQLRSDGVTHVVWLENGGLPVLFFTNAASSQNYHPRYAFNSQDGAEALVSGNNVQPSQMVGSMGLGWLPVVDLPYQTDSPYLKTPQAKRCFALMKAAGDAPTSANAELAALAFCDGLWFIQGAGTAAGSDLTRQTFMAAVDGLGSSFPSALVIGTRFGPGRHDGAAIGRQWQYASACTCFQYVGQPVPLE